MLVGRFLPLCRALDHEAGSGPANKLCVDFVFLFEAACVLFLTEALVLAGFLLESPLICLGGSVAVVHDRPCERVVGMLASLASLDGSQRET